MLRFVEYQVDKAIILYMCHYAFLVTNIMIIYQFIIAILIYSKGAYNITIIDLYLISFYSV
jgi:hypothetical protein